MRRDRVLYVEAVAVAVLLLIGWVMALAGML